MLAGTIVASNYLAMAGVLARSYLDAHPDRRFVIVLIDDGDATAVVDDDRIDVWRLDDLGVDQHQIDVMRTVHDVREFATSVKPAFLRSVLEHHEVACYVDPDICVYAPFDDVIDRARTAGIVLTPHAVTPLPRDGCDPDEPTLLRAGVFNLGFVAVGRSALPFLDWWHERLVTDAIVDLPAGYHTDQRWIDFVPSLFDHERCSDPTLNIAYWNAHERPVEIVDGSPMVFGDPVRFVHFSGYDPGRPDVLSHWVERPRYDFSPGCALRTLADRYAAELIDAGHLDRRRGGYRFDVAEDGTTLTLPMRRMWRKAFVDELRRTGSFDAVTVPPAFGPDHVRFGEWLDDVAGGTAADPHSRRERLVWMSRPDLRAAFDDVDGAGAAGFRRWLDHDPDARCELGDHRPSWHTVGPLDPGGSRMRRTVGRVRRSAGSARARLSHVRSGVVGARTTRSLPSSDRRVAFLHVPKSAGTSLAEQLRSGLPDRRWSPWVLDPDQFGPYRDRDLSEHLARIVVPDPGRLSEFDAVTGHFSLPTLLQGFRPADVITVLREPRSRLLSHHRYWRNLSASQIDEHDTWADINATARELDFADWLADRRVAYQTDNIVARMIVPDHPAILVDDFIDPSAVPDLIDAAVSRLSTLGWVDVVERGDAVFVDIGRHLDIVLTSARRNTTVDRSSPVPREQLFGAEAAERLRARTAVDRALWRWAADERGLADADGLADVVWAARLDTVLA